MYVGIAIVEPPTARPRKTRASDSVHQSFAAPLSRTPIANTAAMPMIALRRPTFLTMTLVPSAPSTAPSRIDEVMISVMLCAAEPKRSSLMWNSSVTCSIAPEITPVS